MVKHIYSTSYKFRNYISSSMPFHPWASLFLIFVLIATIFSNPCLADLTTRSYNVADINYCATGVDNDEVLSSKQSIVFGQTDVTTQGITDITWYDEPKPGINTDPHGRIYVEINHDGVLATYTVNLYKSPKEPGGSYLPADLVGTGTFYEGAGAVTISESNGSALSGVFGIVDDTNGFVDQDIVIATQTLDRVTNSRTAKLFLGGGSATSGLMFTAQAAYIGEAGNQISVELRDPGLPNQTLTVYVDGYDITVMLATDAAGDIDSSASIAMMVAMAMSSSTEANALVNVTTTGGFGVVKPCAKTYLTGGVVAGDGNISITGDTDGFATIAVSGLEVGVNTDPDGKLYVTVTDIFIPVHVPIYYPETLVYIAYANLPDTISVHKAPSPYDSEDLVAFYYAGMDFADGDTVVLDERNNSGLRIAVDIENVFDLGQFSASTWQINWIKPIAVPNFDLLGGFDISFSASESYTPTGIAITEYEWSLEGNVISTWLDFNYTFPHYAYAPEMGIPALPSFEVTLRVKNANGVWSDPKLILVDWIPGDFDGNNKVDFADFIILKSFNSDGDKLLADVDNNGIVDLADFIYLKTHYGESR
ncbi:MAG: hypothetical protein JXA52_05695 [Planctomycetes bacterium]|nr:hypothetical protein [Planctomycetota bacterium]